MTGRLVSPASGRALPSNVVTGCALAGRSITMYSEDVMATASNQQPVAARAAGTVAVSMHPAV